MPFTNKHDRKYWMTTLSSFYDIALLCTTNYNILGLN